MLVKQDQYVEKSYIYVYEFPYLCPNYNIYVQIAMYVYPNCNIFNPNGNIYVQNVNRYVSKCCVIFKQFDVYMSRNFTTYIFSCK